MITPKLEPLFKLETYQRQPRFQNGFYQQDILSVNQFNKENLDYIFERADEMKAMAHQWGTCDLLKDYTLACVFYEPSTRTSSSFISAMARLGVKSSPSPKASSTRRSPKVNR